VCGGGTRPHARLEGGVGINYRALDVLGVGGIDTARASFTCYPIDRDVRTYVQICKPVAGFVTENLKMIVKSPENLVGIVALTLYEIPSRSGSRQRRHVGRRERNGPGKELQPMITVWLEFVACVVRVSHTA
jgi:hypothetical protein